ncbi:MAG: YiiX/YebB-like N1pC/P60 family cysteine hydrolase [Fermentimonas sp.]|nr:YiiX/YebB-like N1pC/P60 family cysteine hydrolase [Fermentimonas sp.]
MILNIFRNYISKTTFTASLISLMFLFNGCSYPDKTFKYQSGDLLFSVGSSDSDFTSAIQESTSKNDEIPYSHVGIVSVEDDTIFVIEATTKGGVIKSTLEEFFAEAADIDGKKLIAVGRLIPELRYTIPEALKTASTHMGKEYDYFYDECNDSFYCSELVRFSFIDSTGNHIFEPLEMSFKNKESGESDPFWEAHFQKLNTDVPEGQPGTNPADMAKLQEINIIHTFF